jgi:DNA-3-methyladenine glycosylase
MKPLPGAFYEREDVVAIARDLLGMPLFTEIDGILTGGFITETEAYAGITDRASHAYGNRRTDRTEVMYAKGGTAYIYLCYGIHSLFNIVTNKANVPHAVLIRAIRPETGLETMLERSGKSKPDAGFAIGPGKVAKLLGIHYSFSGTDLTKKPDGNKGTFIWLEESGHERMPGKIISGPRIGVDYAGEDALLPYRFRIA